MTSGADRAYSVAREDRDSWGKLVESAVGAHFFNGLSGTGMEVFYWREGNREVDFVLKGKGRVTAVEVTSSRRKDSLPGMTAFARAFHPQRQLLVGGQGISIEESLPTPADKWVNP